MLEANVNSHAVEVICWGADRALAHLRISLVRRPSRATTTSCGRLPRPRGVFPVDDDAVKLLRLAIIDRGQARTPARCQNEHNWQAQQPVGTPRRRRRVMGHGMARGAQRALLPDDGASCIDADWLRLVVVIGCGPLGTELARFCGWTGCSGVCLSRVIPGGAGSSSGELVGECAEPGDWRGRGGRGCFAAGCPVAAGADTA